MKYPNAVEWILNSLDISNFVRPTVTFVTPVLLLISARGGREEHYPCELQLDLLFSSPGDLINPFSDELHEMSSTLTTFGDGSVVTRIYELLDKSPLYSPLRYDSEVGHINYDDIILDELKKNMRLNAQAKDRTYMISIVGGIEAIRLYDAGHTGIINAIRTYFMDQGLVISLSDVRDIMTDVRIRREKARLYGSFAYGDPAFDFLDFYETRMKSYHNFTNLSLLKTLVDKALA